MPHISRVLNLLWFLCPIIPHFISYIQSIALSQLLNLKIERGRGGEKEKGYRGCVCKTGAPDSQLIRLEPLSLAPHLLR